MFIFTQINVTANSILNCTIVMTKSRVCDVPAASPQGEETKKGVFMQF